MSKGYTDCCVCADGDCQRVHPSRLAHSYCSRHEGLGSPFPAPKKAMRVEDWILVAFAVALIFAAALMGGCAHAQRPIAGPPVEPAPASQPASQPAPCVSRATFNRLANLFVERFADAGHALIDCQEQGAITNSKLEASEARADEAEAKLLLAEILGPTVTAVVISAVGALVLHFSAPRAPAH